MDQDDFLARKEQILNRNSAKNFKEFNIENELKDRVAKIDEVAEYNQLKVMKAACKARSLSYA